ncbi:cytochrome b5-related protein-like [Uranotaenia lowii]|uniref:cytochrome b5-related protein-like n=1 Tax=Uranotaenia lowii TaxID=190385 RepID=UPI00247A9996|nr:cytochrome b5-related protein-like [Uranotaenia lowii]
MIFKFNERSPATESPQLKAALKHQLVMTERMEKCSDKADQQLVSTICRKYPTLRDEQPFKTVYRWLEGKRQDDAVGNLWRIHDTLYDLSDFADQHPGGTSWIRLTKGTDITEAFETHHIETYAEKLLPRFKVGEAKHPRNVTLTFHEDGFFRTLKRRVREQLRFVNRTPIESSKTIIDCLIVTVSLFAALAIRQQSYLFAALTGVLVSWTMIASHNYFHKRDNWRMRLFNLAFLSYREWRIAHILSHHLYPNSLLDLEMSYFEPVFCWLPDPNTKGSFQRYGSWVYGPTFYALGCMIDFLNRFVISIKDLKPAFHWDDSVSFILPIFMFLIGYPDTSLTEVLSMWIFIICVASFCFSFTSANSAHHHPDIVHNGDLIPDNMDFGLYQIATIVDRSDVKGSLFAVLITYGDHCLHHLFPTLDHAILPQLYPVFLETCKQFETEYRENGWIDHIVGQHQQLARIETTIYDPKKKLKNRVH